MLGISKQLLQNTKEFSRKLPVNLSEENIDHFNINLKYKCPDLFVYFFKSVSFLPDSTLFFFKIWPLEISFLFFKKRIRHHSIKGIFDITKSWTEATFKKTETYYLIIHDPWTLNYYHWMTQALPRLLLVKKTKSKYCLLLPKTHCKEFHLESLKLLGVEKWITFETDKTFYKANDLIYPNRDVQVGDYNDDLIIELSLALRSKITSPSIKRHIFIHRPSKNTRKIINDDEVLSTFLMWGFQIVDFERLGFEDQRKLAGEASILAGVHGAGLTNMLFMARGAKVLELTTQLNGEQYYYYTLSNALGHDYYYQLCRPETDGKTIQDANLFVDIELLKKNLELMIYHNND